jgi:hypothetical protein
LNRHRHARIFEACRAMPPGGTRPDAVTRIERDDATALAVAMDSADFVLIDGVVFETAYLRVPDEDTVADDIVLEAKHGDTEVAFTRLEIEGAAHLGEGVYQLKSGARLRFLTGATIH